MGTGHLLPDGPPADAVRARRRPAGLRTRVRQLHGGRRDRPGRRALHRRLRRRRRDACRRPSSCSCWRSRLRAASFALALTMRPSREPPAPAADAALVPVTILLRVPGLVAVIIAGIIIVAASDIVRDLRAAARRRARHRRRRHRHPADACGPPPRWCRGCSMRASSRRVGRCPLMIAQHAVQRCDLRARSRCRCRCGRCMSSSR